MNIEAQVEMITAKQQIKAFVKEAINDGLSEAEFLAILEGMVAENKEAFPIMKLWAQEAYKELRPPKKG